jgi:hypothetical protein
MYLNNSGVRSQLVFPENAIFISIFYLLISHKEHIQKIKHFSLYFYLSRSHRVHDKEHMYTRNISIS